MTQWRPSKTITFILKNKRSQNNYHYTLYLSYDFRPWATYYELWYWRKPLPEWVVCLSIQYQTQLSKSRIHVSELHRKLLPPTIIFESWTYTSRYYANSHKEIFEFLKTLVNEHWRYTIESELIDEYAVNYLELLSL